MTLRELLRALPDARLTSPGAASADPEVTWVAPRADRAGPGSVVVCVPGLAADGHDFAPQAVAAGCRLLVVERPLSLDVAQVVVPDARLALALLADALAGHPSRDLDVVGVTGTNGKTTTTYLLRAVLESAGRPCGLVGTVETVVGGRPEPATHTTPDPVALHALLARMREAGDAACAMEVSSHALAQRRVAGVRFAAALFTNLTRDHLDYHADVEDYFGAKARLFRRPPGEGDDPPGAANADDPHGRRLIAEMGALGFGIDTPAAVAARDVRTAPSGTRARVDTPRGPVDVETRLRGRYNLLNCLGVVAVGELLGLPHDAVATGLASVHGVPGRLEPIEEGQPFQVLVDYAHTPDSLENVLRAMRALAGDGRLIVVFGCGGDRDRGKRPLMGAIARNLADVALVTSDNPRSEDPDAIIREILDGAGAGPGELRVQPDRRLAIAEALGLAGDRDVVVIAGKGHERGQEVAGVVTPFDDREVARQVLTRGARVAG
jgi:UDP-N-acetylmuramoyl-L-alanyl-D-glutamate--2,6-diaminopimelate ligase